jgi:hypothetical protein
MPSWRIEVSNTSGQTANLDLIDTLGPLNEWQSVDLDAFQPSKGHFINQFGRIVPSEQPSWFLSDLDIDKVQVGSTGWGEVLKNGGRFSEGEVQWKVLSAL